MKNLTIKQAALIVAASGLLNSEQAAAVEAVVKADYSRAATFLAECDIAAAIVREKFGIDKLEALQFVDDLYVMAQQ